jgi:hypothetical protein
MVLIAAQHCYCVNPAIAAIRSSTNPQAANISEGILPNQQIEDTCAGASEESEQSLARLTKQASPKVRCPNANQAIGCSV